MEGVRSGTVVALQDPAPVLYVVPIQCPCHEVLKHFEYHPGSQQFEGRILKMPLDSLGCLKQGLVLINFGYSQEKQRNLVRGERERLAERSRNQGTCARGKRAQEAFPALGSRLVRAQFYFPLRGSKRRKPLLT